MEDMGLLSGETSVNSSIDLISKVYPNPSNKKIFLEAENIDEHIINITILNLNGEIVMKKDIASEGRVLKDNLDISKLSKGMYIINIQIGDTVLFDKFVKQ